jgi:hypothetical protein
MAAAASDSRISASPKMYWLEAPMIIGPNPMPMTFMVLGEPTADRQAGGHRNEGAQSSDVPHL